MSGAAGPASRRGGSRTWLLGLACGLLVALATPLALLAGLLLAPALAAWLLDATPGRGVARPMLLCGLAAALRPLLDLWAAGHGMAASLELAGDLAGVALAWAAQGAAWLVAQLAPFLCGLAQAARDHARIARLRAARARLEQEWGAEAETET
jgi:hypothetical protein